MIDMPLIVFAAITAVFMALAMRKPERRNPHVDRRRPRWHVRPPR